MHREAEVSGELIFVVDDDDAVRASLQALLETAGYRTGQFESGVAFLDSVESSPGACVLLDVKMPGLDGLEVQRRLNHRGVPLLVITVGTAISQWRYRRCVPERPIFSNSR